MNLQFLSFADSSFLEWEDESGPARKVMFQMTEKIWMRCWDWCHDSTRNFQSVKISNIPDDIRYKMHQHHFDIFATVAVATIKC